MSQPLAPNEYHCTMCGNVYEKEWSDEEAWQETQGYWPDASQQSCAVICDDCWQKIHPENHPQEYQESLQKMNATSQFHCGECSGDMSFLTTVTIGQNTEDITCRHCGNLWHITYTIHSLEPFVTSDVEIRRSLGILKDGLFFSRGQLS